MSDSKLTAKQAHEILFHLIDEGWLIGVEVFGTEECCEHGQRGIDDPWCPSMSHGLMDVFSKHSVGSDCNRAEAFLLRPKDGLMTNVIKAVRVEEVDG